MYIKPCIIIYMAYKKQLVIFSISHLAVDFACFYILKGYFYNNIKDIVVISVGFLIYNFIAFALQMPIGYIADKIGKGHAYFAISGCLLVSAGLMFPLFPWVKLGLCALGNALFHVGGGIDSLAGAGGRFSRSGIFISFGAVGVALGTAAGRFGWLPAWGVLIPLIICAVLQWIFCRNKFSVYEFQLQETNRPYKLSIDNVGAVIGIALIGIVIRAFVGAYAPIKFDDTVFFIFLPAVCVFAGKFSGGILCDVFGARTVTVVSLVLSAPLLVFFPTNAALICAGLLLFNINTAATLCVIASKLRYNPAFAFGLTTLALFIGTAPAFFAAIAPRVLPYLLFALILTSAACMLLTVPNKNKNFRREQNVFT